MLHANDPLDDLRIYLACGAAHHDLLHVRQGQSGSCVMIIHFIDLWRLCFLPQQGNTEERKQLGRQQGIEIPRIIKTGVLVQQETVIIVTLACAAGIPSPAPAG